MGSVDELDEFTAVQNSRKPLRGKHPCCTNSWGFVRNFLLIARAGALYDAVVINAFRLHEQPLALVAQGLGLKDLGQTGEVIRIPVRDHDAVDRLRFLDRVAPGIARQDSGRTVDCHRRRCGSPCRLVFRLRLYPPC
jgi:hypothetical protein